MASEHKVFFQIGRGRTKFRRDVGWPSHIPLTRWHTAVMPRPELCRNTHRGSSSRKVFGRVAARHMSHLSSDVHANNFRMLRQRIVVGDPSARRCHHACTAVLLPGFNAGGRGLCDILCCLPIDHLHRHYWLEGLVGSSAMCLGVDLVPVEHCSVVGRCNWLVFQGVADGDHMPFPLPH